VRFVLTRVWGELGYPLADGLLTAERIPIIIMKSHILLTGNKYHDLLDVYFTRL